MVAAAVQRHLSSTYQPPLLSWNLSTGTPDELVASQDATTDQRDNSAPSVAAELERPAAAAFTFDLGKSTHSTSSLYYLLGEPVGVDAVSLKFANSANTY
jgi:hypothetical protein